MCPSEASATRGDHYLEQRRQRRELLLHQGDERRHHDRDAGQHQRGQLSEGSNQVFKKNKEMQ